MHIALEIVLKVKRTDSLKGLVYSAWHVVITYEYMLLFIALIRKRIEFIKF